MTRTVVNPDGSTVVIPHPSTPSPSSPEGGASGPVTVSGSTFCVIDSNGNITVPNLSGMINLPVDGVTIYSPDDYWGGDPGQGTELDLIKNNASDFFTVVGGDAIYEVHVTGFVNADAADVGEDVVLRISGGEQGSVITIPASVTGFFALNCEAWSWKDDSGVNISIACDASRLSVAPTVSYRMFIKRK